MPPLSFAIRSAEGDLPYPTVRKDFGTTASVNGDIHVRVWRLKVESEGLYHNVTAGGEVNGYIRPQLTFGAGSSVSGILIPLAIAFALLAALTLVALVVARGEESGPKLV